MQAFASIFFNVYPVEADISFNAVNLYRHNAVFTNRRCMLAYLVAFGQVGVKIIFAGKIVVLFDTAIQCKAQPDSKFHCLLIHLWQSAGVRQSNRAYVGIGLAAKCSAVAAKQLAFCEQLGMHFKPDNCLVFVINHQGIKVNVLIELLMPIF